MSKQLEYRGYIGSAEVDTEDNLLFGRLQHIRDVVSYSATTAVELEVAFREAVDDYIQTCAARGVEPEKPFKGSFNVRIGPERHRALARIAEQQGVNLNEAVCRAVDLFAAANGPASGASHLTIDTSAGAEMVVATTYDRPRLQLVSSR